MFSIYHAAAGAIRLFAAGACAGLSPADAPFQHAAADLAPAAAFEARGPAAPVAAGPVILVLDGSVKGAGKGRERGPVCWWLVP